MPGQSAAWRTRNVGRLLFSATDLFVRDKLRVVHASGFDLVTQTHMALVQNLDLEGTRLTRIAERARMTKQSMLELVDKLAALGFVERRPDPDDRRAKMVVFTAAGLRMLDRLRLGISAAERRMTDVMGAAFVAEMKIQLAAYTSAADMGAAAGLRMSDRNAAWRMQNAGRVLVSASGTFVRDVLGAVHEDGFTEMAAVHLTLFRNLDLGGTRLTEIAARARVTKQAMAELVDKTAALGLIARVPDPDDRRAKIIVFTPEGHQVLGRLRKGVEAAEQRMAAATGKAFVTELRAQLAAYVAAVALSTDHNAAEHRARAERDTASGLEHVALSAADV